MMEPQVTREKNPPPPPGAVTLYDRVGGHAGLSRLIKWFYAKARYDPLLEPIFRENIPVWSEHLAVITDFWAQVTGGPQNYRGGMGRHFRLGLDPVHFEAWLSIWEQNCIELLYGAETSEMIALARSIGDDMQRMAARRSAPGAVPFTASSAPGKTSR